MTDAELQAIRERMEQGIRGAGTELQSIIYTEDVPALLAEVERLRGEVKAERALWQEAADHIQECKDELGGPTYIGETLKDIIRRSPVPEKP